MDGFNLIPTVRMTTRLDLQELEQELIDLATQHQDLHPHPSQEKMPKLFRESSMSMRVRWSGICPLNSE